MKLLKLGIVLWGLIWFGGLLIAFPGNVFLLVVAFVGYLCVSLTLGSSDYWRRYSERLDEKREENLRN
jgi:hypothetical protein